jgi:hypothetical protein
MGLVLLETIPAGNPEGKDFGSRDEIPSIVVNGTNAT